MKIIGIVVLVLIIIGAGIWASTYFNSTSSTTLNPTGNTTGKALVVYDPGLSGAPKTVATTMAEDLKSMGYTVTLAGINSKDAKNISNYDVLIIGSPTYAGNPSSTVKSYINTLNVNNNTRVGVFSYGGGADDQDSNKVMQQLLQDKGVNVKVSIKYDTNAGQNDYSNYIKQLLA